jgi:hypothetical protein
MVNNLMHFGSQGPVPNGAAERRRRLLKLHQIWNVTEPLARVAAPLRTETGRAATIPVTDAIVVALAPEHAQALILTS